MGVKGSAYDNASAESIYSTLKEDLICRKTWPTKARARDAIFECIEVSHNSKRLHTRLGNLSPVEVEMINQPLIESG